MQRFFTLIALFVFALPVGISIAGCGHNPANYCLKNGHAYGPTTTQVAYITLQPVTTGLSVSWGQTAQLQQPQAYNCNNGTETVSKYTYSSTNLQLADISPTGMVCGGTWNRNSEGGIANFTICTPPAGAAASCNVAGACGVAQLTATGGAATSNPVNVYVHPPVTSIAITPTTSTQSGTGSSSASGCVSQGQTLASTLLSETQVYGPDGTLIPSQDVGTIAYTAVNPTIVTINNTTNPTSGAPSTSSPATSPNGTATANQPGSTVITASVAGVSAAAGYFYTCPPKSIALNINGQESATVTPSLPQTVAAVVTDTNGVIINGLALDFASTQPQNLTVASTGTVTANFPGAASVTAICQPTTCNPSPINEVGTNGTGTPVVSNTISVTSPGRSSQQIWMASPQSQFFSEIDLTTTTSGSPVRLPYVPNSMVADENALTLFFGSYRELMVYSTANNTLTKQDTNVPGVVLAVSPDDSTVVINDQLRQVIYLYTNASSSYTSISGVATNAHFSPDGKNAYIVGPSALYVHNVNTGWSTYSIPTTQSASGCALNNNTSPTTVPFDPFCGPDLALTVPSVGPFLTGSTTTARSFCPNNSVTPPYYPEAASVAASTEHLGATPDGKHILGADTSTFSDIGVTVPTGQCPSVTSATPLTFATTLNQIPLPVGATEISQVTPSPDSSVAFVTYSATGATGLLPLYKPNSSGAVGSLTTLQLAGGALDPIAGIFSPDGSIFFVGTTGDDLVHMVSPSSLTDTEQINPKLTDSNGNPVAPQFFVVKSRSTT